MIRLAPRFAAGLLLSACAASAPPSPGPALAEVSATASQPPALPAPPASAAPASAPLSAVTFDSNFAFDIRPMAPFAPLLQRIGPPASRAGANTFHWNGASESALDIETLGDKIHRAMVTTPDGSHLIIEPESAGQSLLSSPRAADVSLQQSALGAVDHWAQAWSSRDVDAYLACYMPDFHAPGTTREQWVAQRRQRLQSARDVRVRVDTPQVEPIGDTRVRVHFVQHYAASNHRDTTSKTLELWQLDGHWRIVSENSR